MAEAETKVTHTPGPWTAEKFEQEFTVWSPDVDDEGNRVAARIFSAEDAALIAAAPDMLEALEAIESETLDEYAEDRSLEDLHKQLARILFVAQAAIAKAKGGAA